MFSLLGLEAGSSKFIHVLSIQVPKGNKLFELGVTISPGDVRRVDARVLLEESRNEYQSVSECLHSIKGFVYR